MRKSEGGVLYAFNPDGDMWRKMESGNYRSTGDHEARCRGRPCQIWCWAGPWNSRLRNWATSTGDAFTCERGGNNFMVGVSHEDSNRAPASTEGWEDEDNVERSKRYACYTSTGC